MGLMPCAGKLTHYASIMLDAYLCLPACSKLCWHNCHKPTYSITCGNLLIITSSLLYSLKTNFNGFMAFEASTNILAMKINCLHM